MVGGRDEKMKEVKRRKEGKRKDRREVEKERRKDGVADHLEDEGRL